MNQAKPWWQSRTHWLNLVTLMVTLFTAVLNPDFVKQNPQLAAAIGSAIAFANIVLRNLTSAPIQGTSADPNAPS